MSPPSENSREILERLFSIVIELDDESRVAAASPVALAHMPWLADRPRLTDAFEFIRPRGITEPEDVLDRGDQLFLLKARDGSFALRGQVITVTRNDRKTATFCGAPWLFWVNSERPDLSLQIRDFSPQDAQLDQLFFMTTEQIMVSDLEQLNTQLQEAKNELEAAQRARDAFFAHMSHEMRTPLNGVVSALALIEENGLPRRTQELLAMIRSSSRNLMNVINYVLDVSKIDAKEGANESRPFRLDELVESVLEIVEPRALEKRLMLQLEVEPGLPDAFLGDSVRLHQTLLNLVSNAIKFTDEGQVTVHLALVDDPSPRLRIDVSDTGIGIPEDLQESIFEPFFSRPQPGNAGAESGTGLGLDIVRRAVKLMGGELTLTSSPGAGSTFSFSVPLEPVDEPLAERNIEPPDDGDAGPLTGHVLLVDDNRTNLMLGTMLLEDLGLTVTGAATGEEAVEAVENRCYCAVLMDISMPGIDGFEATRQIRLLPGRHNVPILALTAYASSREQARALEAGMNDYLTKPVSKSQLVDALRQWLPGSAESTESPTRQAGAETSVNVAVLEELVREIGTENLVRIIETFGSEARDRWSALTVADSAPGLAREAHSLVSTCRSFGLDTIADALAGIEARARQGLSEDAASLEALGERLEESLAALLAWTPSEPENSRPVA